MKFIFRARYSEIHSTQIAQQWDIDGKRRRPNEKTSSVDDVKGVRACIYTKVQKNCGIIPEVADVQVQGEK